MRSLLFAALLTCLTTMPSLAQVKTTAGVVEGDTAAGGAVRVFKGIPYAAPPVGDLRWKAPQPVQPWTGVRRATEYGPRCHQGPIFGDMVFRSDPSEDCLSLNVWVPAKPGASPLPVMVWIHGGGFQAGASSEPRHDGDHLAQKGVMLVTINYRLGVFGFFSYRDAVAGESAVGNAAFLDMIAALQWVKDNAAAFGGDPGNVTIFGESAGSFAVSGLMAAPPARGLFHKAIGQSGAFFGATLAPMARSAAEEHGKKLADALGAARLAELRKRPAEQVLQAALKIQPWFGPTIDGDVLRGDVLSTYIGGEQAPVPLLAGWNADESRAGVVLAKAPPTAKTFVEQTQKRFGPHADEVLRVYRATSDAEALESAASLASDMFIGYGTWKWLDLHASTGKAPVFRYSFDRKIPIEPGRVVNGRTVTAEDVGARHAGDIEYVFGTLDSVKGVTWSEDDRKLADAMMTYWSSFARTGRPHGDGLPEWPAFEGIDGKVQQLDVTIRTAPEQYRERYEVLQMLMSAAERESAARQGRLSEPSVTIGIVR